METTLSGNLIFEKIDHAKDQELNYRAYQIRVKKGHRLYDYFMEQSRLAKNLYNHANFFIRQTYTALMQEKSLEANQQEVMDTIAKYLPIINENQQEAWKKREAEVKAGTRRQPNQEKPKLFSTPTKEKYYLGIDFLDDLFRIDEGRKLCSDLGTDRTRGAQKPESELEVFFCLSKRV